jgi:KaiC/GvpD/RAD55 family RecA-like ATPase
MAESDLIRTGITGLDDILRGGFPRGNVLLVEGAAGTGKTILGLEFVYRGITEHREPGLIVTFEVTPSKLIRDAAAFGWDLEGLQRQNQLKIIFTSPQVLSQELRSPDSVLLEAVAQMGAQRIFIEGISLLRTVSNQLNHANGDEGNGVGSYRQLLQLLLEGLQRENLTAMLSHEVTAVEQQAFALEVTEFLCDTVIFLRREPNRRRTHRSLEITKSRGRTTTPAGTRCASLLARGLRSSAGCRPRPRATPCASRRPAPGSRSSAPTPSTSCSAAASSTAPSRWWLASRARARRCWARSCCWKGQPTAGAA